MRAIVIWWLLLLLVFIQSPVFGKPSDNLRIAYINACDNFDPATNLPSVPVAFLERAKKANYTHIMVEFYILEAGDWNEQGDFKDRSYTSGNLYLMLRGIVDAVHSSGLKLLPFIHVTGTGKVSPWWPSFVNNTKVECYSSHPGRLPCIASGLLMPDGSRLQPDGFEHLFIETMKVLHAAYASKYTENLEYICLGYSECFDGNSLIWGSRAAGNSGPVKSIDRKWMEATGRNESFLAIESIRRRVDNIRNINSGNSRFAISRAIVCGDMFSMTFQNALGRTSVITTELPVNVKADLDFKSKVVVMPWWYDECRAGVTGCSETDPADFKTADMLGEFTNNTIETCPIYCITEIASGFTELEICRRYLREAFEYMSAVRQPPIKNSVIGFAAAHWNPNGYNTTDLTWNTIEYLAYGNQAARPPTLFSSIPQGTITGRNINRLLCSRTEITQGDYLAVTGKLLFNNNKFNGRLDYPVENMTFYDAVLYCNARSEKDGLIPVYAYDPVQQSAFSGENRETCTSLRNLSADTSKNGYRLPSPAEWEYICNAGAATDYYWGSTFSLAHCWCKDNATQITMPVGLKKPNAWNIYDISGNVNELTCDYYPGMALAAQYKKGSTFEYASNPCFRKSWKFQTVDRDAVSPRVGFRIVRKAP